MFYWCVYNCFSYFTIDIVICALIALNYIKFEKKKNKKIRIWKFINANHFQQNGYCEWIEGANILIKNDLFSECFDIMINTINCMKQFSNLKQLNQSYT